MRLASAAVLSLACAIEAMHDPARCLRKFLGADPTSFLTMTCMRLASLANPMGSNLRVNGPSGRGKNHQPHRCRFGGQRPQAVLLASAKGLTSPLESILQQLPSIGGGVYAVRWEVINIAHHGLPQHRERLYIMGLLRSSPPCASGAGQEVVAVCQA